MSVNSALWEKVSTTDPKHVKLLPKEAYGYVAHSTDPMYLAKMLTDLVGPCGVGWGVKEESYHEVTIPNVDGGQEIMCVVRVSVWIMWGGQRCEAQHRAGWKMVERRKTYYVVDEDAPTKAYTHAWKKAFSLLGVSADVYFGEFEDAKYSQEAAQKIKADLESKTDERMQAQLDALLVVQCGCTSDEEKLAVIRHATGTETSNIGCLGQPGVASKLFSEIIAYRRLKDISFPQLLTEAKQCVLSS